MSNEFSECDGSDKCPAALHVHGCYTPHASTECDSPRDWGHTDQPTDEIPPVTGHGNTEARTETSRCARKCCWTNYGHSTVRDHLPSWDVRACTCHTKKENGND